MTDPIIPGGGTVKADPKRPWKAIAGAVVTLLGLLWAALEGRTDDLGNMTGGEWLSVIVPTLLTFAAVYGIRNPKVVDRDERGAVDPMVVVIVVLLVVILLAVLGFLR